MIMKAKKMDGYKQSVDRPSKENTSHITVRRKNEDNVLENNTNNWNTPEKDFFFGDASNQSIGLFSYFLRFFFQDVFRLLFL